MPVTVYTRTTCAPCKTVKYWLDKKGIQFTEKNVDEDPAFAAEAFARSGLTSVPVTVVGDKVVSGMNLSLLSNLLMV